MEHGQHSKSAQIETVAHLAKSLRFKITRFQRPLITHELAVLGFISHQKHDSCHNLSCLCGPVPLTGVSQITPVPTPPQSTQHSVKSLQESQFKLTMVMLTVRPKIYFLCHSLP